MIPEVHVEDWFRYLTAVPEFSSAAVETKLAWEIATKYGVIWPLPGRD